MGKTNFQSLKDLTTQLTEKLEQLSNGQLKLDEIEQLTDQAKELYERLVIIRYKAYEGREPQADSIVPVMEKIEQLTEDKKEELTVEEEDMMMFDFSGNEEDDNQAPPPPISEDAKEVSASIVSKNITGDDRSLNDNYKKEDGSVGDKFEKAPIKDLKEHIGINRKFLYVNDLFKGDGNAYNAAIGALNTCNSQAEAFEKVNSLKSEQGWETDNQTVMGFIELVERRYLS